MKVKTEELIAPALDWVVTRANFEINFDEVWRNFRSECEYSTDWAQGGPIIERERIDILAAEEGCWSCYKNLLDDSIEDDLEYINSGTSFNGFGPTPLIAAMRCYVASKLGNEVEIPEGLIK